MSSSARRGSLKRYALPWHRAWRYSQLLVVFKRADDGLALHLVEEVDRLAKAGLGEKVTQSRRELRTLAMAKMVDGFRNFLELAQLFLRITLAQLPISDDIESALEKFAQVGPLIDRHALTIARGAL